MPAWAQNYLFDGGLLIGMGYVIWLLVKRELLRTEKAILDGNTAREDLARDLRQRNELLEREIEQRYELCMKEMHQRHSQHDDRMRALEINRVTRADFDELRMSIMATITGANERIEQQVRELRTYLMDNPRRRQ